MRCNQLYLSCFIFVMFPSVARVAICVEETEDEDADFLGEARDCGDTPAPSHAQGRGERRVVGWRKGTRTVAPLPWLLSNGRGITTTLGIQAAECGAGSGRAGGGNLPLPVACLGEA